MKTILIARSRKTGKHVILLDDDIPIAEQKDKLRKLHGSRSEEYSEAVVAHIAPSGPVMRFSTEAESKAKAKATKAFEDANEKAMAEKLAKNRPYTVQQARRDQAELDARTKVNADELAGKAKVESGVISETDSTGKVTVTPKATQTHPGRIHAAEDDDADAKKKAGKIEAEKAADAKRHSSGGYSHSHR